MKLIIDIPEYDYSTIVNDERYMPLDISVAIKNGTPIPDNATNGDVLEQITAEIYEHFMTIDGGVHDASAIKCMEIIGKYK